MKNAIRIIVLDYYRSFQFAITPDSRNTSTVSCSAGGSRAVALGTRRFDGALYSACTRENAVMMVARP